MKKLLILLLTLLTAVALLTGCGNKPAPAETTADATPLPGDLVETDPPAPAGLTVIAADGSTQFKIIRPEQPGHIQKVNTLPSSRCSASL